MFDIIPAYKPRQLNVATQLIEAQPTCSLGLGYKWLVGIAITCQWTHRLTFLVLQSAPARPQWAC